MNWEYAGEVPIPFGKAGAEARFESQAIPGLAVAVHPAPGRKCERWWHRTEDVGADPEWPEICARCARAVRG